MTDVARKFVFENADVRGELTRLSTCYQELQQIHQYAPGVSRLLGEFLAAAVLLSTTIKFEGRLILQAQSDGELPLIMAECNSEREVRAIAHGAEHATSDSFARLLSGGRLAITIDPRKGQRYQGIVALDGDTLADCLESYFRHSEQLPTRLWLASDGEEATGLLLQQLPVQVCPDETLRQDNWEHLCALADTLAPREQLEISDGELLHRLFHEDPLRLFDEQIVRFACSCSRERSATALMSLGAQELESLFEEQSTVTIDCEFCNQQYNFEAADFEDLLGSGSPESLH